LLLLLALFQADGTVLFDTDFLLSTWHSFAETEVTDLLNAPNSHSKSRQLDPPNSSRAGSADSVCSTLRSIL